MMKLLKQKNKDKNAGFTLVETLIAISIFSFSIMGLLLVLAQGISDTGFAKKKIIAGYLAQEGIEYVRNMRDSYVLYTDAFAWIDFKDKLIDTCPNNIPCQFDDSSSTFEESSIENCVNGCKLYVEDGDYNYDSTIGIDSGFTRILEAKSINDNEIQIISTVSWDQGSGSHEIVLFENLFNWVE